MMTTVIDRSRRAAALGKRAAAEIALLRRDAFINAPPSAQTAIDAVPDKWASSLPASLGEVRAGSVDLFDDERIHWALEQLGGVQGETVLDLGPLEGGHSYMAHQAGARKVVGVEANSKAFLKCLVTKELLELDRCRFLCGDVAQYLEQTTERFDTCIACGILYHMVDPVALIELISRRATKLIMWTHVYADEALSKSELAARLGPAQESAYGDFNYRLHRHGYGLDTRLSGFFGGVAGHSNWMPRDDLMRTLDHFGWRSVRVAFDEPHHQNGPALALVAVRDAPSAPEAE